MIFNSRLIVKGLTPLSNPFSARIVVVYDRAVNPVAHLPATESLGRGIIIICIGLSLAAFSGALMKLLGNQISVVQVAWFRFAGMSLLMLPFLLWRYRLSVLRPARPLVQIVRGLTLAAATTLFVKGSQTVDYADAIAILYAYPFLLVIVASLILDEKAGWTVWIGVIGGFTGVLLVMRPEFDQINIGTFLILACAAVISVQLALNRKLGQVSPPLITAFAGAVCATVVLSLMLPGQWQAVPDSAWPWIALLVLSGTINQTLLVLAFVYADASTLAPFTYVEIVAAVILGFLFFGTLPSLLSWAGILLITASGIYVARAIHLRNVSRRVPRI